MKPDLLRKLPSVGRMLETDEVRTWLAEHPRGLVTDCLRAAVDRLREWIVADTSGDCGQAEVGEDNVLALARAELDRRTSPQIRKAINATGIILHTALGRAVWPEPVVDSMADDLAGYVTLAVDRETGRRSERDNRVESILRELTGAEAATVVNNNAAATLLVLTALAAGKEVVVSRGQLIEIGGAFRLPDVMAAGGARMVEVGTTNRTHLRDYAGAITDQTAMLFRAHPSNFRVVGFTSEVPLGEMVELARSRGLVVVDDLGAGALIDLERFGLPHEPTMGESIAAGADVVLASGDKLMGASQAGVIVGRRECIERIRKHPLSRALRPDKTCLMALERTLQMFRDPDRLIRDHPTYRMLATPAEKLRARADALLAEIAERATGFDARVVESVGYLGSGSLPMEELPGWAVSVSEAHLSPAELARRLRMDEACVFTRVEHERVVLDVRTITDEQVPAVAAALARVAS